MSNDDKTRRQGAPSQRARRPSSNQVPQRQPSNNDGWKRQYRTGAKRPAPPRQEPQAPQRARTNNERPLRGRQTPIDAAALEKSKQKLGKKRKISFGELTSVDDFFEPTPPTQAAPPRRERNNPRKTKKANRKVAFGELSSVDDFFEDHQHAPLSVAEISEDRPKPIHSTSIDLDEPMELDDPVGIEPEISDYPDLDLEADKRRTRRLAQAQQKRSRKTAQPPVQERGHFPGHEPIEFEPMEDESMELEHHHGAPAPPMAKPPQRPPSSPLQPARGPSSGHIQALQRQIQALEERLAQAPAPAAPAPISTPIEDDGHSPIVTDLLPPNWGKTPAVAQAAAGARRQRIDFFLRLMIDKGASDFHIHVGNSPIFRLSGRMAPMRYRPIRQSDWERLMRPICPDHLWSAFEKGGDVDFSYAIPGVARFRVNLMKQHHGGGAVFRLIPNTIMTLEQLGLPEQVQRYAEMSQGLVLVTGPTGSGKSTSLAALIDLINRRKSYHIITIEDPIEFVHEPKRSLLHQREIGTHAQNFNDALRAAIREDPDLILVGEMRDRETMLLALEAAEKGMLVFGTLHTNSAAKTVDRIINAFSVAEQDQVRHVLASTLQGVVSQQLLRRVGGGRVAALEILFSSPALGNLIREGKTHHIPSFMQTGLKQGMMQMDQALMALLKEGTITREAALEKAIEKDLFKDPSLDRYAKEK